MSTRRQVEYEQAEAGFVLLGTLSLLPLPLAQHALPYVAYTHASARFISMWLVSLCFTGEQVRVGAATRC